MVLLLTATVNPGIKVYTKLIDPEIRKKQYIEAINFYLYNTDAKIVVCENSGYDLSPFIKTYGLEERIEFLTFNGNFFNPKFGKSFGEANIIRYAFDNSQLLKNECFFIKITGRVKVINIKDILRQAYKLRDENTISIELSYFNYAKSVCFVTSKKWMNKTFNKYLHRLNDSILFNFEKMLFKSILDSPKIKIKKCLAIIDGISGTENLPYPNYSFPQINLNHYNTLYKVYLIRHNLIKFILCYFQWLFYIPLRKIYVFFNE